VLDLKDELRQTIETVLMPLIKGYDRHICLLDPPNFPNVGDNLILLGELAFLKANFPRARLSSFDILNYSPQCDPLIEQCSVLLIHGGGNFGDIWPLHQQFRELILLRFPHKRIIQLPQSISFSTPEKTSQCAALIAGVEDFHLMVRDTVSEAFARSNFACSVHLVPDMAFCLPAMTRLPPTVDVTCLLRSDKEAVADHAAIKTIVAEHSDSYLIVDWNSEAPNFLSRLNFLMAKVTRVNPSLTWPINGWMLQLRKYYAQARARAGVAMLGSGRQVVTDRLHAHILSLLLGISHFAFNSADGKIGSLYRTWTHGYRPAVMVEKPEALRFLLKSV